MHTGVVNAPEINSRFGWVNSDKAFSIKDFRGKIVLLDFWTYGCINCQHIIPELERLEKEFGDELVVIGIHSAKFDHEKLSENIAKAIVKYGIKHPVVNDADYEIWEQYGIRAWPTVVLVSPEGKIVGQKSGENIYVPVKQHILLLLEQFRGRLSTGPAVSLNTGRKAGLLNFPASLVAGEFGSFFLSNTGQNQILHLDERGKVLETIGSGQKKLSDGSYHQAAFNEPRGLAMFKHYLYVADTGNHAIRQIDLLAREVKTLAGNGQPGYYFFNKDWEDEVLPNSPGGLCVLQNILYIANAGNHQLLKMDLPAGKTRRFAGSGREALLDGDIKKAAFTQPSGITNLNGLLYVADSEGSAIREVDPVSETVLTVAGTGLFTFGDQDGPLVDALLQHPEEIVAHQGLLYLADCYNGKVKVVNLAENTITTWATGLAEPGGMAFQPNGNCWISDTNNHRLLVKIPGSSELQEVKIRF